jgi:dTDP-4-amino-4,6-dideoxygalactose transaminase
MKGMAKLAKKYGFFIIEDACHAIGGRYLEQPIGCCQYSDIAVFSFHPVKIITTAEGGMAVTNQPVLAEKIGSLRRHGITRDPNKMTHEADGDWYYQQIDLGFNSRMTELQAALGVSQIRSLDKFVKTRHKLQQRYDEILKDLPLILPYQDPDSYSALHLYPIQINGDKSRKQTFDELRKRGIGVNVHYIPVHTQPYYQNMGFKQGDYPVAEKYYSKAITLPLFYDLTIELQDEVVETLTKVLS